MRGSDPRISTKQLNVTYANENAKISIKNLTSEDRDSSSRKFQDTGKPREKNYGADVGPRSVSENSGRCLGRSAEIPTPWQTSIDKSNDCVVNLNGVRWLRAPTHPKVTVLTQRLVICGGRVTVLTQRLVICGGR